MEENDEQDRDGTETLDIGPKSPVFGCSPGLLTRVQEAVTSGRQDLRNRRLSAVGDGHEKG